MVENSKIQLLSLFSIAAIIVAIIFWRGLSGGFLLDDFPNLALLSQLPADASFSQLLNLSTNGISGFMGRPLSMISFLLQAESWPANPFNFKVVNLIIHLINGGLVALILLKAGEINPRFILPVPLIVLAVFLWMLHPIQVSNVLYVVQRMNLLTSFFTLLGIYGYLWSRLNYQQSNQRPFLATMALLPAIAALLGLLSKENGVLIYVFLAVLELTLLKESETSAKLGRARIIAVFIPLSLGAIAFLFYLPTVLADYDVKSFTLIERAFTQFPVLLSYLQTIFIPRFGAYSLFHDNFPVYSSLLSLPVLVSFLCIVASICFAIWGRNKYPIASFAIAWYFLGHSLESTFLPLELYFEHRNYLPLLGPIIALVFSLQWAWQRWESRKNQMSSVSAVLVLWLAWVSLQQATIWGNPIEHAYAEVFFRPDSYRAQSHLVQTVTNSGDPATGYELHSQFIAAGNARISDYVRSLEFGCLLEEVAFPTEEVLRVSAQSAEQDFSVISLVNNLVNGISRGACQSVPVSSVNVVLEELAENPEFAVSRPDLLQIRALSSANTGNFELAATLAEESFRLRRDIRVGLLRISWLVEAGDFSQATEVLEAFESEFADEISSRQGLAQQIQILRASL